MARWAVRAVGVITGLESFELDGVFDSPEGVAGCAAVGCFCFELFIFELFLDLADTVEGFEVSSGETGIVFDAFVALGGSEGFDVSVDAVVVGIGFAYLFSEFREFLDGVEVSIACLVFTVWASFLGERLDVYFSGAGMERNLVWSCFFVLVLELFDCLAEHLDDQAGAFFAHGDAEV